MQNLLNLIQGLDVALLTQIKNLLTDPMINTFTLITSLGDGGLIWIGLILLLFIKKQTRPYGFLCLLALCLSTGLAELVIKPLVARPRPFVSHADFMALVDPGSEFSFPSGHTASSVAVAYMLYKAKPLLGWLGFTLAGLIAVSRLFLFVHYPSDVMAGALLGLASGVVVYGLYKRYKAKKMTA